MKRLFLRPARTATSLIFCMALASGCGGGSGGGGSSTPAPNPVDAISASGIVTLDTTNSVANTGGASQSGTLILVSASGASTATFVDDPSLVAPGNTITNQILRIGDGVGSQFSMSGNSTVGASTTDGVFADFEIEIQNPSASQSVRVTFRAVVSNTVSATGTDSFAFSAVSVRDATNVEVYFSDHRIDTQNPGIDLAADSASDVFSIVLAPGASTKLTALQSQRGGVIAGDYAATLDAFIRIDGIDLV